jgi:predicted glycoside hydrolase/deacetylase ChbG (UPF0249 family)
MGRDIRTPNGPLSLGVNQPVPGDRSLIITADDYGIGPEVSRAIRELGAEGRLTATVLLVTSPHAATTVQAWRKAGCPVAMGWHPCLTLDGPILTPERVPSLVQTTGKFWSLGAFMRRLCLGQIRSVDLTVELTAQYDRFLELIGRPPQMVNSHQHVQIFPQVGAALCDVLSCRQPLPYLRRIQEPWSMLARVPGARCKRAFLTLLGRRDARRQEALRFPGNHSLAGVADSRSVTDPDYLVRWLRSIPGEVVELACHPGYRDETLIGRDCEPNDGMLERRVLEMQQLREPRFLDTCRQAGFRLLSAEELLPGGRVRRAHVA